MSRNHDHTARRSASLSVVQETIEGPVNDAQQSGQPAERQLWRSIEQLQGTSSEQGERPYEFPVGSDTIDGVSRRGFVQLLGASLALTGAACTRPNQNIVPYVRRPPEVTPGNALTFATAYELDGYGIGLVVESHTGRPTKVEGNPDHPYSLGASTVYHQALPLNLYDPNRARQIVDEGQPAAWLGLLRKLADRGQALAADGGAKLRFLVEPSSSPLLGDLRARILQRFPQAKFVAWSPADAGGESEGTRLAFGRPLQTRHDLTQATVILSLDSDFLTDGPEQVRLHRQFSNRRTPPDMNRLYVVEPSPTPTGFMADHRLRVRGSDVASVALALVAKLATQPGFEGLSGLKGAANPPATVDGRWIEALAKDLARNRGRSVVIAGRRQPAAVHALAHALNVALGNVGKTVIHTAPVRLDAASGVEGLRALAEEIAAGAVDTLVITAHNPVYTAPADLKLNKLLERVPHSIYLGLYMDETAAVAKTFVPAAHTLESWGDTRAVDGTVSLIQPLIAPLWSSVTTADLLGAFVGQGDRGSHALLREYWQKRVAAGNANAPHGFDGLWEGWLAKGVVENTAAAPESQTPLSGALAGALSPLLSQPPAGGIELAFQLDNSVYDGRFANNAWLQELPDPVTKVTWDNAVLLSTTTAAKLGLKLADVVRIEVGDRQLSGPVYIQPGHADDAITVALGYGRKGEEAIARGVGFNAYELRTTTSPWFLQGVSLTKTAKGYKFGITQEHWSMEGREPAISTTLAALPKTAEKLSHLRGALPTLQAPVSYDDQQYKWAMAIDLSKCSGCSACMIACQSENNIPVVGRENVAKSREMHWLRIDRYYAGPIEDPEVETQPLMCVHCETAPCEYVCPVNATVHSDEGLNEMVYNRCIGTRYCSNNCPYKVRRFNFLDYHGETPATRKMAANPDVTVRSRGVMEKCTYCVQRIERARIDSRVEARAIGDGELLTACQQSCPADAIVFGSLNDPNSRVSQLHKSERRYDLLHELNTRPRTAYLARVRNPNPELA